MDMWFESDICWCMNSDTCTNTNCFRHLINQNPKEKIFTCGLLKDTEYCPLTKESEEK